MKVDKNTILLYMPNGGQAGVIQAWYSGDHHWVEFRGPSFNEWGTDLLSPFQIIHDSLLGMHATVLHQDSILAIIQSRHSDFNAIDQLMKLEKDLIFHKPADVFDL